MMVVRCQIPNVFCLEIKLERVAESFRQKQDFLSVMRPVGSLAKPRYLSDVGRQMVCGTFAGIGFSSPGPYTGKKNEEQDEFGVVHERSVWGWFRDHHSQTGEKINHKEYREHKEKLDCQSHPQGILNGATLERQSRNQSGKR
jgi:hypothetical protein